MSTTDKSGRLAATAAISNHGRVSDPIRFTITGPPRTKKNHSRVVRAGRFTKVLPSLAHEAWFALASSQAPTILRRIQGTPITGPVQVTARFYRDANRGDLNGYQQALGDWLEAVCIIEDDKWIESWDGSRKLVDKQNPRIEVEITELRENAPGAGGKG
jgi:Holliday junction resolvase RusA-like endonuclease